jgi:myo-inositol-1-phosphate synthase
LNYTDANFITL